MTEKKSETKPTKRATKQKPKKKKRLTKEEKAVQKQLKKEQRAKNFRKWKAIMIGCGTMVVCSFTTLIGLMIIGAMSNPGSTFCKTMVKIPVVSDLIFTNEKKAMIGLTLFWDNLEDPDLRSEYMEDMSMRLTGKVEFKCDSDSEYSMDQDWEISADVTKSEEDILVNLIFDGSLEENDGYADIDVLLYDNDWFVRINEYEGSEEFFVAMLGEENLEGYDDFEEGLEDVYDEWYEVPNLSDAGDTISGIMEYYSYFGYGASEEDLPENIDEIITLAVKLTRKGFGPYDGVYEGTQKLGQGKAYVFNFDHFDLMAQLIIEGAKAYSDDNESDIELSIETKFGVDKVGIPRYILVGFDWESEENDDVVMNYEWRLEEIGKQKINRPEDPKDFDDLADVLDLVSPESETEYEWDDDYEYDEYLMEEDSEEGDTQGESDSSEAAEEENEGSALEKSRDAQRKADVSEISFALMSYKTEGVEDVDFSDPNICGGEVMLSCEDGYSDIVTADSPYTGQCSLNTALEIEDGTYLVSMPVDPTRALGNDTGYDICYTENGFQVRAFGEVEEEIISKGF